jgi:glycine cleavage system H protein
MQLGSLLDYRFSAEHEWVCQLPGSSAAAPYAIGITDYAQQALGDIVYVSVPPGGQVAQKDQPMGEIESTKSVTDVYAPADLEVIEVNGEIDDDPSLVNVDPYGSGWLLRVRLLEPSQLNSLRDIVRYRVEVAEEVAHVFILDDWNKIHYLPAVRAEDGLILSHGSRLRSFAARSLIDVSKIAMADLAEEFEELINKSHLNSADIRLFFSRHPEFLLGREYNELREKFSLRSQITLQEDVGRDMRPDFILKPVAGLAPDANIVDLGLPADPVVQPKSADGTLYDNIVEAVAQLRAYARYFDTRENREYVRETLGFTPYVPRLTLIVGKGIEFDTEGVVRNALRQAEPVEIVTYSDILKKYRRLIDDRKPL